MNLLIDIGNSRIKWALATAAGLQETGHMPVATITAESLEALLNQRVQMVYIASVGQAAVQQLVVDAVRRKGIRVELITTQRQFAGVRHGYSRHAQHGVDRWLACLAAYARGAGNVLVADAGTAVTLDYVAADGQHTGGPIMPGLRLMGQSLGEHTAIHASAKPSSCDWQVRDTETAIANGTVLAISCLLNAAAQRFVSQRLVLTGGDAEVLAPLLEKKWLVVPNLVLEGMQFYNKNSEN